MDGLNRKEQKQNLNESNEFLNKKIKNSLLINIFFLL